MIRRLLGLTVCLALGLGVASAQDAFMERYQLAIDSLEQSVAGLAEDPAGSLASLERAAATLRPLSEETTSKTLIGAMEATFERARTAVSNESQIDLAVQVAVLEGGFQRIAYEAALRVAREGDRELAQERLARVAADMSLPQATQNAFGGAPLPQLQLSFERGVAQSIAALVERARAQAPGNVNGAYRNLATAYGNYIPIQDSPRISPEIGSSFVNAFDALVNQQGEGLAPSLESLLVHAEALSAAVNDAFADLDRAASAPPATPVANPAPRTEPAPAPTPAASVVSEPAPEATTTPAPSTAAVVAAPAAPAAAANPPTASQPSPAPAASAPAASQTAEQGAQAQPASDAPSLNTQALERELARYRLNPAVRDRLVALYSGNQLGSVDEVLTETFASGARVLVAVKAGDQVEAKDLLAAMSADYRRFLEPLVDARNGDFNASTLRLMDTLEASPALRLQDAAVLVERIDAITNVLDGRQPALTHTLEATTLGYWTGFLRLTLMIVLGILAFIPLYLLNLAFGGGNRNWRWIGVSLLLLLLPVIYEALSYLGSLAATLSGVDMLGALTGYSLFQNTLAQLIWVVLTVVAIGFAVAGLYGICVQFGLLGRGGGGSSVENPTTFAGDGAPEAIVEWDEEF